MDIYVVAQNPELAGLVSHEGKIYPRYPEVPTEQPLYAPGVAGNQLITQGAAPVPPPPPEPGQNFKVETRVVLSSVQSEVAVIGAAAVAGYYLYKFLRKRM